MQGAALDIPQAVPAPLATADEVIDAFQRWQVQYPAIVLPLTHRFTRTEPGPNGRGIYIREIFMPAGAIVSSKIHRTQHPFVISKGRCAVWSDPSGLVELQAPYTGITEPWTRRVILIYEDTVWTTFHATDSTDPAAIEFDIIEPRYEHLAGLVQPSIEEFERMLAADREKHLAQGGATCETNDSSKGS